MKSSRRRALSLVALVPLTLAPLGCSGATGTDLTSPNDSSSGSAEAAPGLIDGGRPVASANYFQLSAGDLKVTFGPSGGTQVLTYQSGDFSRSFSGKELTITPTPAGVFVSGYLKTSIDTGSTSFTLLVPRVRVPLNEWAPVETQAITAVHHYSVVPALDRGQLDTFTFTPLTGSVLGISPDGQ